MCQSSKNFVNFDEMFLQLSCAAKLRGPIPIGGDRGQALWGISASTALKVNVTPSHKVPYAFHTHSIHPKRSRNMLLLTCPHCNIEAEKGFARLFREIDLQSMHKTLPVLSDCVGI